MPRQLVRRIGDKYKHTKFKTLKHIYINKKRNK